MRPADLSEAEKFLKTQESFCVSACSKFIMFNTAQDHLWTIRAGRTSKAPQERITNLLFHCQRVLYPIFADRTSIPVPRFMERFARKISIHAIQGIAKDVAILETILGAYGYRISDAFDYDLMSLDQAPTEESLHKGPNDLILRSPELSDLEALYPLQAAYEIEEVLPKGAVFNPASCLANLQHTLGQEPALVAMLDGRMIGKAQVNAASFSRLQIGGVYVHPDYRGRGIATRMTAVLSQQLLAMNKGLTLFVKKRNTPAQRAYSTIGFKTIGDYRICYY